MPVEAAVHVLRSCLLVLTALFPIVNPLGNSPIFLSLTPGYSSGSRAILARSIALNSFWLLTGSMLIGSHILDFFGISIPVVQIGGGLVVMSTGWALLKSDGEPPPAEDMGTKLTPQDIAQRAFYPLTLPLTVGPGSISVALTLGANESYRSTAVRLIASTVGPALVALTVFLSYRFAERLAHFLGHTAMNVIIRLGSFILLCIGVQIFWNGISTLGTSFFNRR
jgi:multiple antibiotic resistance protein